MKCCRVLIEGETPHGCRILGVHGVAGNGGEWWEIARGLRVFLRVFAGGDDIGGGYVDGAPNPQGKAARAGV